MKKQKTILAACILLLVLLAGFFIPIRTKAITYCKLNSNIKQHYSLLRGDGSFFNSDLINATVDSSGLLCYGGDFKVRLYIL